MRQRLHVRTGALARAAVRLAALLLAAALIAGGGAVLALALGAAPDDVDRLTGYRTAFDWAAGLGAADLTPGVRRTVGLAGAATGLVALVLTWRALPRPALAREPLGLEGAGPGATAVHPRAVERAAEVAARGVAGVARAAARLDGDALVVAVGVRDHAADLDGVLLEAHRRASAALPTHGLPALPVDLVLTRFDHTTRRDLA